jgi:protocatechuate 3,4-dioxygenase beta subunit
MHFPHAIFLCQLLLAAITAAAQSGATVQGRVTSSAHGEPVANALVTLRGMEARGAAQPQTYICQTGADGRFTIAGVAPGVYDPMPSKPGFVGRPPARLATANDFPPVTVEAGKPVTGLELRLIPESVIAGRVLDADGDPVRRAQVEAQQYAYVSGARQLRSMHQVQTDDRGEYRMFNLPPGRYYVRAEATPRSSPRMFQFNAQVRGTLPPTTLAAAYYPGAADPSRATELQALPGAELDGIDISLAPEKRYSIRGKLPAGDPSKARRGVRVAERSGNMARFQSLSFPGRDTYEVRDVAPGSYIVIGDSIDPANPEERQFARQPVDVVDRDVDGVDLTFSPGVKVKGTVKVDGSATVPLGDLTLFLQSTDFSGQQPARIAADGTFSSAEMAPGIYQVRIGGRNAYLKSLRLGDQELPERKIDTEHLSGDVTVVIGSDFGQVEGTVTDEAGKPVYNANVTLIPDQSRPDWQDRFYSMFTLPSGRFNFASVQPGEYKAYAWLGVEPGAPQSADFRKPYEDRAVPVKIEANSRQSVDLKPIVLAPGQ